MIALTQQLKKIVSCKSIVCGKREMKIPIQTEKKGINMSGNFMVERKLH